MVDSANFRVILKNDTNDRCLFFQRKKGLFSGHIFSMYFTLCLNNRKFVQGMFQTFFCSISEEFTDFPKMLLNCKMIRIHLRSLGSRYTSVTIYALFSLNIMQITLESKMEN